MTFIWIIICIISMVLFMFILLWLNAIRGSGSVLKRLDAKIRPAVTAVIEKHESTKDIILRLAAMPETRNHLYAWLKDNDNQELFPEEFRSIEKIAESDLARWLMHPNELKEAPGEIELVRKVPVLDGDRKGSYYLFKFKMNDSHWASKDGWLAGTAGPYWDDFDNPDISHGTFSELLPFESLTEEQHIEQLQKTATKWGFVIPS